MLVRYIGRGSPPVDNLDGIEEIVLDSGTSPLDAVAAAAAVDFSPRALKSIVLFDCDHPRCTVSVQPVCLVFSDLSLMHFFALLVSLHFYFNPKHLLFFFVYLGHIGHGATAKRSVAIPRCPVARGHQQFHYHSRPQRALQQGQAAASRY